MAMPWNGSTSGSGGSIMMSLTTVILVMPLGILGVLPFLPSCPVFVLRTSLKVAIYSVEAPWKDGITSKRKGSSFDHPFSDGHFIDLYYNFAILNAQHEIYSWCKFRKKHNQHGVWGGDSSLNIQNVPFMLKASGVPPITRAVCILGIRWGMILLRLIYLRHRYSEKKPPKPLNLMQLWCNEFKICSKERFYSKCWLQWLFFFDNGHFFSNLQVK